MAQTQPATTHTVLTVTVQYALTVKWVKTTPTGAVAPSWTAYLIEERFAILTYLPGRTYGLA